MIEGAPRPDSFTSKTSWREDEFAKVRCPAFVGSSFVWGLRVSRNMQSPPGKNYFLAAS
jgi:hypothetical protein